MQMTYDNHAYDVLMNITVQDNFNKFPLRVRTDKLACVCVCVYAVNNFKTRRAPSKYELHVPGKGNNPHSP